MESPNLAPSPDTASAAADSVAFSLTGSTFSAIEVIVSNNVLNSVVTDVASITASAVIDCGAGSFGDVNDTYLLPNTVVATMLASTLAGMNCTYFGSTPSMSLAAGLPSCSTSEMLATRPIATPL